MSNATIVACVYNSKVLRNRPGLSPDDSPGQQFKPYGTCNDNGWTLAEIEFKKLFEGAETQPTNRSPIPEREAFIKVGLNHTPSAIKTAQAQVQQMRDRIDQLKTDIEQLPDSHKLLERPVVGVAPRSPDVSSLAQDFCMGLAIVMSFYVLGAMGAVVLRALRLMD